MISLFHSFFPPEMTEKIKTTMSVRSISNQDMLNCINIGRIGSVSTDTISYATKKTVCTSIVPLYQVEVIFMIKRGDFLPKLASFVIHTMNE
ncbi:uncharacterized protein M6B38_141315 [Iris pallida]|uniref:Uncharacterized protein n=1 Tax=Iris pallida TaxID=29817 RepID=A0AAX6FDK6_IRIPA|nr:uncharacterized protein M6B38_141315 [Iris pallida]